MSANPDRVTIDLSQIGTFFADLGANGSLLMGTLGDIPASGVGVSPNLFILAGASNSISAGSFYIGAGGMQNQPQLLLGAGTNILNSDNILLGNGYAVANRDCGIIKFYDTPTVSGSVRIRGYTGAASRANLRLGDGPAGTGGAATNIVDFSGHHADLLLGSLVLGNQPSRVGAWEQTFSFDQGILEATTVSMSAAKNAGSANPGSRTNHIGGGTASLGPVGLTASAASGTLNITGGWVRVQGVTNTGTGTGTLMVSGASLASVGPLGTVSHPIDVISLDNATLSIGRNPGYGNPSSSLVNATTLSISGTCPIALTGSNYVVGQFPLISYTGTIGGGGLASLGPLTTPAGVVATLVDNAANHSIDVKITAARTPVQAILGVTSGSGMIGLTWNNLGMLLQTNSVSVTSPADWFVYPGSASVTNLLLPIDLGKANVFFRLVYP